MPLRVDARADELGTDLALELRQVELAVRGIDRVVAVGVEQRHDDERELREQIARASPSSRSRISIRLASLPSTSPAWMPLMISTTGRPARRASSGVFTPCADSTTSGSSRPPGLVPNDDSEPPVAACVERGEELHHVAWSEVSR